MAASPCCRGTHGLHARTGLSGLALLEVDGYVSALALAAPLMLTLGSWLR